METIGRVPVLSGLTRGLNGLLKGLMRSNIFKLVVKTIYGNVEASLLYQGFRRVL